MKRLIFVAALAAAITGGLNACSQAQLQTAQGAAVKLQNTITLACNVIQPAIAPWAPFFVGNAAVTAFNTDVLLVCASNTVINLTSINSVISTTGSAAQAAVAALPNLTKEQVALIQGIIGAFQGSLKNALMAYQAAVPVATPTAPASAPAVAPAPASGSAA